MAEGFSSPAAGNSNLSPDGPVFVPRDSAESPGMRAMPPTSHENQLCPSYSQDGSCFYGNACTFAHGEMCEFCLLNVLHPQNEMQRQEHKKNCVYQHELDMKQAFAEAASAGKKCGICMEVVVNKPYKARCFGMLQNCKHIFCLECIRKWRKQDESDMAKDACTFAHGEMCEFCLLKVLHPQDKKQRQEHLKSLSGVPCPSDFVTPSSVWTDDETVKTKIIMNYLTELGKKPCKYFDQGNGECRFGNKYDHVKPPSAPAPPPSPPAFSPAAGPSSSTASVSSASKLSAQAPVFVPRALNFGNLENFENLENVDFGALDVSEEVDPLDANEIEQETDVPSFVDASGASYAMAAGAYGMPAGQACLPPTRHIGSKNQLCPYYSQDGSCFYGDAGTFAHGELCEFCLLNVLHPQDKQQRQEHLKTCVKQHELEAFAEAASEDKQCGICMEVVVKKTSKVYVAFCSIARDTTATYTAWGHSVLVDPWGQVIAAAKEDETILQAEISTERLSEVRKQVPITNQRRLDLYTLAAQTNHTIVNCD